MPVKKVKHHTTTQTKLRKLFVLSKLFILLFLLIPQPVLASTLFNITHEGGDLSEYDSTVTDGGDLSAASAAALAGTNYGMQAVIDDTNNIFADKNISPPASNKIRYRFYFDPNSVSMTDGGFSAIFQLLLSASPTALVAQYLKYSSGNYVLGTSYYNDAGWLASKDVTISDEVHYIEVYAQRASSNVASDGQYELWINGVSQGTQGSVDNYDSFAIINNIRAGAISFGGMISGTLYLDELRANDDGSEIGAFGGDGIPRSLLFPPEKLAIGGGEKD